MTARKSAAVPGNTLLRSRRNRTEVAGPIPPDSWWPERAARCGSGCVWGGSKPFIPSLREAMAGEENVIFESNSILRFFQPNLYLSVLDPATKDFKASAREFLGRADAFLLLGPGLGNSPWEGISLDTAAGQTGLLHPAGLLCDSGNRELRRSPAGGRGDKQQHPQIWRISPITSTSADYFIAFSVCAISVSADLSSDVLY